MNHETDKQIDQSPHPTLAPVAETPELFESRKADHIRLALSNETQALGGSGLQSVRLRHEALPDINFDEVSLEVSLRQSRSYSDVRKQHDGWTCRQWRPESPHGESLRKAKLANGCRFTKTSTHR